MFRSFFPNPVNFFVSAIAWTAVAMTIWFTAGTFLEPYLSLGPWLAVPATAASPAGSTPAQPNGARPGAAATTQGIIMRDGGVCDPIRHMGC